ncbi:hypothetical protein [Nocardia aurantia]|uniref:Uncharacterized protein n=1 Tax=Nocardia aurantia TaxID=2585199 RepID=A0A7K0DIC0_9NOCA|nr:hypothetical protein [Nocardia aurantia]MQY25407.1 hypothetical protein [Nocardia aurantia]
MPKRISDVSLHVYVTPETLERVVATVRRVVDDHVADRDVFAWRFTLPVDTDHHAHMMLETRWRLDNPGTEPVAHGTYEIALSLVGPPDLLTEADLSSLERQLVQGISKGHGCGATAVPYVLHASSRDSFDLEEHAELEHLTSF